MVEESHSSPTQRRISQCDILDDPLKLCEALRSKDTSKWEAAMQEEYDLLMASGTWESTKLPKDHKSVGCKWVFPTKKDAAYEIIRCKA